MLHGIVRPDARCAVPLFYDLAGQVKPLSWEVIFSFTTTDTIFQQKTSCNHCPMLAQNKHSGHVVKLFGAGIISTFRSSTECSLRCQTSPRESCSAFHFDEDSKSCQLGSKALLSQATTNPGDGSVTSVYTNDEDAWHLIVGGVNATQSLRDVELFNWQTGVSCYLGDYAIICEAYI